MLRGQSLPRNRGRVAPRSGDGWGLCQDEEPVSPRPPSPPVPACGRSTLPTSGEGFGGGLPGPVSVRHELPYFQALVQVRTLRNLPWPASGVRAAGAGAFPEPPPPRRAAHEAAVPDGPQPARAFACGAALAFFAAGLAGGDA